MEISKDIYGYIQLKPTSMTILKFLNENEPMKAEDIATKLDMKTRAVDAAVTKSLVHYGLAVREHKLTECLKKEYNLIRITDTGRNFLKVKEEI